MSWQMPARNASDGSVLNIDRVDVYRLADPLSAPQSISEEDFASRSVIIGSVDVDNEDFGLKRLTYRDELRFAGQSVRLRYAIRFVNSSGQRAAFSNFFLLEPTARVAAAPTSLSTTVTQDYIRLDWTSPTANIDGSTPPNIIGFNVYRAASDDRPAILLSKQPITDSEYRDTSFEFGRTYSYFVRTVSLGAGAIPIESAESEIVKVTPKDTFAPSAPANITLAATPSSISIFFPGNPEIDVVGYRIYRTTEPITPLGEWEPITPEPLTTNTFQDTLVRSGTTYYYYITATDKFGNVSEPSVIVSETVP